MSLDVEKVISDKSEETRGKFHALLDKTNKRAPQSERDVKALSELFITGETLDSAGRVVLVEAEPCGIELLEHNEAIDHTDVGHLLGKAFDGSSKAVHSRV